MNECRIIGYKPCKNKETQENLLRIIIEVNSPDEKQIGNDCVVCFLEDTEQLRNVLNDSREKGLQLYYETTDNIITGKTKIKNFHF